MNVIGSGMLAKAFKLTNITIENTTIFASGVSNSNETNVLEFEREFNLLESLNLSKSRLIYFSTSSICDPELENSSYVIHKKKMELLVKNCFNKYLILRLPQMVGCTENPNTLTNFLYFKLLADESIPIWKNAARSLLDVDDFVKVVIYILKRNLYGNKLLCISPANKINIIDILYIFESVVKKKAKIKLINKGASYDCDSKNLDYIYKDLGLNFDNLYTERVIKKYYG